MKLFSGNFWLRSPGNNTNNTAIGNNTGASNNNNTNNNNVGARPDLHFYVKFY